MGRVVGGSSSKEVDKISLLVFQQSFFWRWGGIELKLIRQLIRRNTIKLKIGMYVEKDVCIWITRCFEITMSEREFTFEARLNWSLVANVNNSGTQWLSWNVGIWLTVYWHRKAPFFVLSVAEFDNVIRLDKQAKVRFMQENTRKTCIQTIDITIGQCVQGNCRQI